MEIIPIKTRVLKEGESLEDFIFEHVHKLEDKDILVITSKIVALSQGRVLPTSAGSKEEVIKKESEDTVQTPWTLLGFKDGEWRASAGIDLSNADGNYILLPSNTQKVAGELREIFIKKYKLKNIGVLITDSRSTPLRSGVEGKMLAFSGFVGMRDYIGKSDIFGREFKMVISNLVDALSSAAGVVMGEGDEQIPLVIIRKAPVEFTDKEQSLAEFPVKPEDDLYWNLFHRKDKKRT